MVYVVIHKIIPIITILIAAIVAFGQTTYALSAEQKNLFDRGVYQFDIEAHSGGACGSVSISLSGNSNAAKAFNFLVGQGLTDYQAAGVVGNLQAESSIIPNRKQGTGMQTIQSIDEVVPNVGFGIAQWTTAGRQEAWRQFAQDKGMNPLSLELQLLYLWHELESDPFYGLEYILDSKDLQQATWIFLAFFERPRTVVVAEKAGDPIQPTSGGAKDTLDERVALANKVTGGGEINSGPTSTGAVASGCQAGNESGGTYSADGYTFPLKVSRDTIINTEPSNWCFNNTNNCHHDYNAADIFAPTGTPVLATRGGRVVTAKDNATDPSAVGTRVTIMGDDGFLYYYAHMGNNTLSVRSGQTVTAGEELGKIGTSANAVGTQPHLHIDRLPGNKYTSRPYCSGAACNGYPFDNIQELMSKIFKEVE